MRHNPDDTDNEGDDPKEFCGFVAGGRVADDYPSHGQIGFPQACVLQVPVQSVGAHPVVQESECTIH